MALHPTLEDFLHNFLKEELDRLINKAAKLELSLYFHQALMKEVCHSIKAHDHWVCYGGHFPFSIHCNLCGEAIPPEFDLGRHRGFCTLKCQTA